MGGLSLVEEGLKLDYRGCLSWGTYNVMLGIWKCKCVVDLEFMDIRLSSYIKYLCKIIDMNTVNIEYMAIYILMHWWDILLSNCWDNLGATGVKCCLINSSASQCKLIFLLRNVNKESVHQCRLIKGQVLNLKEICSERKRAASWISVSDISIFLI